MYCSEHNYREAIGRCISCSRAVCLDCMNKASGKIYCNACHYSSVAGSRDLQLPPSGHTTTVSTLKRRDLAAIMALLLGSFGVHKFYLGQYGWGILYFLFSWSGIPTLAGWVEGILMLVRPEADFIRRYGEANTLALSSTFSVQRNPQLGSASQHRALPPQDYERFLLQFAQRHSGVISMALLMAEHEVDLAKVEDALAKLSAKGLVVTEIDDNGRILHYVPEFRP